MAGVLLAGVAFATACGSTPAPAAAPAPVAPAAAKVTSSTPPADLRAGLNRLFEEHVYLAMGATSAALGGRTDEYKGAVAALDTNSTALGDAISSVYGKDAGAAFLAGWRRHIGFFVDYTNGVANKDEAAKAQAVTNLGQYAQDLAELLNGANGLPKDTVVSLVKSHAGVLCSIIDLQAGPDRMAQFAKTRVGAEQIHQIADPIAEATVLKFPDKFAAPATASR